MSDNREFIEEFLVESSENLDQLDKDLLALEADPADPQRIASVFRTVHTIKGNSGFFGFSKLGALAHCGEHLLGKLRDGKLRLDDRVAGTLYSMVDAVRTILQSIETAGNEGDHDYRELSRTLAAVAEQSQPAVEVVAAPSTPPTPVEPRSAKPAPVESPASEPSAAVAPPTTTIAAPPAPSPPATVAATETTVRVDVELLAAILDLVGELVLARNQLRSVDSDDVAVQACAQRINVVTNALDAVENRPDPWVEIHVEIDRPAGLVRIIVADNGEGMTAETLAEIFNLFVSTKGSRGTGLGLTVSRKILREHDGDIRAESSLGAGSTFTLEFPLTLEADSPADLAASPTLDGPSS